MPPQRLCLVALNPTDSVTEGFLPAARALGLRVTLLTDRPDAHHAAYAGHTAAPDRIVACDVRDHRAIIDHAAGADAVFSNSDHLQTQTALAAAYHGLPAKDWRATLRAKNKALMRRHLPGVRSWELLPGNEIPDVPCPCVVKPREGVASEDVVFVRDAAELSRTCAGIWRRRPEPLVVEEFLTGDLHTLETIGDAGGTQVVGGFRTTLSPLPYFVEQSLVFDAEPPAGQVDAVLAQLAALGVGFGACHTEYVVDGDRVRIIEVNYRAIGDQCDLLLADLTGTPLFEHILRVHLGEPLRTLSKPANTARVDYPCADTSGRLVAAPGPMDVREGGVRLTYRPLRDIGTHREHTNTNRDYLGVLRTIGADEAIVATRAEEFLAGLRWDIRP